MRKKAKNKKLEIDLDLLEKSIKIAPSLPLYDQIIPEFETRTISEIPSSIDFNKGFYDKVLSEKILEKISYHVQKLLEKLVESDNHYQKIIEKEGIIESKTIEKPDSMEIINEEKNMESLIETNRFLILRNDELTKKIEVFTENYEKLVKDNKEINSQLEKRIKELIDSKVSISKTPTHWVNEAFREELENENVE